MNQPQSRNDALEQFSEWFRANYPGPDTIIHKPDWHAPKIFRAVEAALKDHASASEKQATELLREARPYLDLIAPSVSKERPLVMVTTKCDAEALAKRIDDFFGEKA